MNITLRLPRETPERVLDYVRMVTPDCTIARSGQAWEIRLEHRYVSGGDAAELLRCVMDAFTAADLDAPAWFEVCGGERGSRHGRVVALADRRRVVPFPSTGGTAA